MIIEAGKDAWTVPDLDDRQADQTTGALRHRTDASAEGGRRRSSTSPTSASSRPDVRLDNRLSSQGGAPLGGLLVEG